MIVGRTTARFHLLLVLAVALTGVAVLLMVGAATLGGSEYERGLAGLALVLTAPLWLALRPSVEAIMEGHGKDQEQMEAGRCPRAGARCAPSTGTGGPNGPSPMTLAPVPSRAHGQSVPDGREILRANPLPHQSPHSTRDGGSRSRRPRA